jgi:hypothetical protein
MSKLIRLRVFVGVVCLVVLYFSASFARGLLHGPDQGMALNLVRILLGEAAIALSIVAFLGLIWAVLMPRWVVGLLRFAWHHLKYAVYVFYGSLLIVGIYGVALRIFAR